MQSFIYALENEIDEVREGAVEDASDFEVGFIIGQLEMLVDALREGNIDFDETWHDVYDDTHIMLVYEGNGARVLIFDMDGENDEWLSLVCADGKTHDFERGSFGGYYEINDAQQRYTINFEKVS